MKQIDERTRGILNLVERSPGFVARRDEKDQKVVIFKLASLPRASGRYFVAGNTLTKSGHKIRSVFEIDTHADGELRLLYWKAGDRWFFWDDDTAYQALTIKKTDVFPFDWKLDIPLDEDAFHG